MLTSFEDLDPALAPFVGDPGGADDAHDAIIAALNASSALTVGPDMNPGASVPGAVPYPGSPGTFQGWGFANLSGTTGNWISFADGEIGADSEVTIAGISAAVPVPAAVWLFGSALGLVGFLRKRAS